MYKFVLHTFRPTETIDAIFRLKGRHSLTHAELAFMRRAFNELNGLIVPRPGMTYKIPLPFEATDDYGNVVETEKPNLLDDDEVEVVSAPEEVKVSEPIAQKPEDPPKRIRPAQALQVFS